MAAKGFARRNRRGAIQRAGPFFSSRRIECFGRVKLSQKSLSPEWFSSMFLLIGNEHGFKLLSHKGTMAGLSILLSSSCSLLMDLNLRKGNFRHVLDLGQKH
jgi:hypothetical protein